MHVHPAQGTRPKRSGLLFQFINSGTDHGSWTTGDGATGKDGLKGVQTVTAFVKLTFNMADKVLDVGVSFHIKTADTDRTNSTDGPYVVTHEVNQHSVLGSLLVVVEHVFSQPLCFLLIVPLRDSALDGCGSNRDLVVFEQAFWG